MLRYHGELRSPRPMSSMLLSQAAWATSLSSASGSTSSESRQSDQCEPDLAPSVPPPPANQSGVWQALLGDVAPRNGPTSQMNQPVTQSTC